VLPDPSEEILVKAYVLMDEARVHLEGEPPLSILEVVYSQCDRKIGPRDFLDFHDDPHSHTLACFEKIDGVAYIRGMGWLNKVQQVGDTTRAEVGFAFLPGGSIFTKLEMGRRMIDWMFSEAHVDVLFGTTPVQNKPALAYAKRLGFSLHGPIPDFSAWRGQSTDVWVSKLSRKEWYDHRRS
jgi:hypothetical protein